MKNGITNKSKEKPIQSQSKEVNNRRPAGYPWIFGNITFYDKVVLGEGVSMVFPGTFKRWITVLNIIADFLAVEILWLKRIPCVVKRVMKKKGEVMGTSDVKVLEEIEIWQKLSNDRKLMDGDTQLPIVRCYGYDQDQDFW